MSNTNNFIKNEDFRYFLKRLKEKKVFTKFCTACAEAYHDDTFPRSSLNSYLNGIVRGYINSGTVDEFVTGVENWYYYKVALIQP